MKLNKNAIKEVINYVIENQTFDFDNGCMSEIELTTIIKELSQGDENRKQEIACATYRCIQENLLYSNYSKVRWGSAVAFDVTLKGFEWLDNN